MTSTWYVNGRLVLDSQIVETGYLRVQSGQITELGHGKPAGLQATDEVQNLHGNWLIPGFVDVHVHGASGWELLSCDRQEIRRVLQFHGRHGTTCMLASIASAPVTDLTEAISVLAEFVQSDTVDGTRVGGIHVEGPFISDVRKGAMNPEYILNPDTSIVGKWLKLSNHSIRLMTLAPELPGADKVISFLRQNGVTIGAGHTDATYAEALEGFRLGVSHAIHTFNGMRPIHHRDGGVLTAVLTDERVTCELICDGYHVDPSVIRLMYRAKGPTGIALITDAVAGTGLPDGQYGDTQIQEGRIQLADGTLAGSTLTMDRAYKNILAYLPISLVEASLMASTNAAQSVGLGHRKGRLRVGMDADMVVLDENLDVVETIVEGQSVYSRV